VVQNNAFMFVRIKGLKIGIKHIKTKNIRLSKNQRYAIFSFFELILCLNGCLYKIRTITTILSTIMDDKNN